MTKCFDPANALALIAAVILLSVTSVDSGRIANAEEQLNELSDASKETSELVWRSDSAGFSCSVQPGLLLHYSCERRAFAIERIGYTWQSAIGIQLIEMLSAICRQSEPSGSARTNPTASAPARRPDRRMVFPNGYVFRIAQQENGQDETTVSYDGGDTWQDFAPSSHKVDMSKSPDGKFAVIVTHTNHAVGGSLLSSGKMVQDSSVRIFDADGGVSLMVRDGRLFNHHYMMKRESVPLVMSHAEVTGLLTSPTTAQRLQGVRLLHTGYANPENLDLALKLLADSEDEVRSLAMEVFTRSTERPVELTDPLVVQSKAISDAVLLRENRLAKLLECDDEEVAETALQVVAAHGHRLNSQAVHKATRETRAHAGFRASSKFRRAYARACLALRIDIASEKHAALVESGRAKSDPQSQPFTQPTSQGGQSGNRKLTTAGEYLIGHVTNSDGNRHLRVFHTDNGQPHFDILGHKETFRGRERPYPINLFWVCPRSRIILVMDRRSDSRSYELRAIELSSNRVLWTRDFARSWKIALASQANRIAIMSGESWGNGSWNYAPPVSYGFDVIDIQSGDQIGERSHVVTLHPSAGRPAIYMSDDGTRVIAHDKLFAMGQAEPILTLVGSTGEPLSITENFIWFRNKDSSLSGVELASGAELYRLKLEAASSAKIVKVEELPNELIRCSRADGVHDVWQLSSPIE